ncbi:MAG: SWIM zinc finger family protein [Acetobacteraceae bacterium]
MRRYYGGWAPYVPVAARRRKAERETEKLRKIGAAVSPVKIEGRQIARTFWGKAWCDNLESYGDYANRLPRGRTYVRNGSVLDLQVTPREVTAMVSGSDIYRVRISIGEVANARWKALCADCSGRIDSLVELLQGRFSEDVMERICRLNDGLFPRPSEIRFTCSCPDYASMCKHIAAVLYGVGARLDQRPELLFQLRAVDATELLSHLGTAFPGARPDSNVARTLVSDDLAALFDLELADREAVDATQPAKEASSGRPRKSRQSTDAKRGRAAAPSVAADATVAKRARRKRSDLGKQRPRRSDAAPAKAKVAKPTLTEAASPSANQGKPARRARPAAAKPIVDANRRRQHRGD